MKKTLFAMMALAGLASADIDLSFTNSDHTGTAAGNGYFGWCLRLDNAQQLTATITPSTEMPASVTLDNVTYTTRPAAGSGSDVKIAIYEYSGHDGEVGSFVGLSTTSSGTYANNTEYSLSFSDIQLDTGKRYQFLFVDATATVDTLGSFDGYKSVAKGISLSLVNPGTGTTQIPGGWGTYSNSNLNGWAAQWMPKLTIKAHVEETPATPEPATATLSLLALAGLAARRRRH